MTPTRDFLNLNQAVIRDKLVSWSADVLVRTATKSIVCYPLACMNRKSIRSSIPAL